MGATPLPRVAVNLSSPILWTRIEIAALERDLTLRRSRLRSRRRRAHVACQRLIRHHEWMLALPDGPPVPGGRRPVPPKPSDALRHVTRP